MTFADFTLSTPRATPLAVLPPRHKTGAIDRFYIAKMKGNTSVHDRSMLRRLIPTASNTTYAPCSERQSWGGGLGCDTQV